MTTAPPPPSLTFERAGFGADAVDYATAWEHQRELHALRAADAIGDVVVMLEHPSVYTAGRRTQPGDRPADGTLVVEVDRGGKITWHGPGQLVGYPICKLPEKVYVVDYVRRLEEALIRACSDLGLRTGRVKGRSGVWLAADGERAERKVAALGVRVARSVSMHGIALNCDNAMQGFDAIVPCGISDAAVTTLSAELGRPVGVLDALPVVEHHLADMLAWRPYEQSPPLAAAPERVVVTTGLSPLR